jgi:hypothetical protein
MVVVTGREPDSRHPDGAMSSSDAEDDFLEPATPTATQAGHALPLLPQEVPGRARGGAGGAGAAELTRAGERGAAHSYALRKTLQVCVPPTPPGRALAPGPFLVRSAHQLLPFTLCLCHLYHLLDYADPELPPFQKVIVSARKCQSRPWVPTPHSPTAPEREKEQCA